MAWLMLPGYECALVPIWTVHWATWTAEHKLCAYKHLQFDLNKKAIGIVVSNMHLGLYLAGEFSCQVGVLHNLLNLGKLLSES